VKTSAALLCTLALAACGEAGLTDADNAPGAPRREAIPVLVYDHVSPQRFEREMALLAHAGYDTITLDALRRHLRGESVALPPRPFVLTFDGGSRDEFKASDPVLKERGFNAVTFVDTGRVSEHDPAYLSFRELDAMQRGGRWDVQLQSWTGNHLMRWGRRPQDVGPFYAYHGEPEHISSWRERTFGDITAGYRLLARYVRGYRPLAFSPPYGNYGQAGTNDPQIPRLLLARLHQDFPLVFVQDRPALAVRGAGTEGPVGRLKVTDERVLLRLLN
jgi:peptidoglycan/xylan/chitin deacetylase (PgdA/CDA1 family)